MEAASLEDAGGALTGCSSLVRGNSETAKSTRSCNPYPEAVPALPPMTSTLEAPIRPVRALRPRATPPVIDSPATLPAATLLVVDADVRRRDRVVRALANVPATIVACAGAHEAYLEALRAPVALVVLDGRDDPRGAIEWIQKVRATQPFVTAVLVGIEWDRSALLSAINEIDAFRVLKGDARESEVREAVLSGLRAERDHRETARAGRRWVKELLNNIEAALPREQLQQLEHSGGPLPFDLIARTPRERALPKS